MDRRTTTTRRKIEKRMHFNNIHMPMKMTGKAKPEEEEGAAAQKIIPLLYAPDKNKHSIIPCFI